MSKFVGFIVGAALIAVGAFTGNVGLIIQGAAMIVTQAVVDLTMPKQPAREASEMTLALGEQPRCALLGETFTPGSLVDGFNYGGKYGTDHEVLVIRLADHKCDSLTGFFVNDEFVPYAGDGNYPQFDGHHFSLWFRGDTSNDALPSVVTDNGPGWTSADLGKSGCDVIVDYLADKPDAKKPAWPGGRPHFGFVVKGALCYDPRKDSTVSGGSGSHRDDDASTWEWSENAMVCWYKVERGIYAEDDTSDQSKLLVGRGLSAAESPPENIFAGANLCDEGGVSANRYVAKDIPNYGIGLLAFSQDFSRFATASSGSGGVFGLWDTHSRTLLATGAWPSPDGVGPFVFNDTGTVWCVTDATHVCTISADFSSSGNRVTLANAGESIYYCGGYGCVTALTAHHIAQLYDGATVTAVDVGFKPLSYVELGGFPWAIGLSGTDIKLKEIGGSNTGLTLTSPFGSSSTPFGLSNSAGNLAIFQGTHLGIFDTSGTLLHSAAISAGYDIETIINHDGSDSIWIQNKKYSLIDASLEQTVTYTDWDTHAASNMYDPINRALFGAYALGQNEINWLFPPGVRYRIAGPIYSTQQFIDVEGMFAAATGGNVTTHDGAVLLEPGQAKTSSFSFTDDDLLVGGGVTWNNGFLSESDQEWVNTIVANYIEPDQKWNPHDAPVLRDTSDITADGKPREASLTLRLVRYQDQALRVAEINRRLGRIWGRATVKLGPRFCEIEEGDWGTWQSDRYFGGDTKAFRVDAYSIDEKWQITLTLREIASTVYDDDGVFGIDQSSPTPRLPPPAIGSPDSGDWTLTPATLVSTGASVPVLQIDGAVPDDENVESIIVEYWLSDGVTDPTVDPDSIPWIMVGTYAPSITQIQIPGLTGGGTYYVALTYVVSGIPGDRLVMGPETVADLTIPKQTESLEVACSDETTALTAGTAKVTFRMPYAFTATGVRASLATAQASGSIFTVDINEAGTSILSTKLTIDNTEKTSATAATPAVISDASLADDAEMTVDIDQIGNGSAKGLKIILIGHQ